jgi:hypothetical protein
MSANGDERMAQPLAFVDYRPRPPSSSSSIILVSPDPYLESFGYAMCSTNQVIANIMQRFIGMAARPTCSPTGRVSGTELALASRQTRRLDVLAREPTSLISTVKFEVSIDRNPPGKVWQRLCQRARRIRGLHLETFQRCSGRVSP